MMNLIRVPDDVELVAEFPPAIRGDQSRRYRVLVIASHDPTTFGFLGVPDGGFGGFPTLVATDDDLAIHGFAVTLDGQPVASTDIPRWITAGTVG